MQINGDEEFTNSPLVLLTLEPDKAQTVLEYALFTDEQCTGTPDWKTFRSAVPYTLKSIDSNQSVSVLYKYKNQDLKEASNFKIGPCVLDRITLDTTKPIVEIKGSKLINTKFSEFDIIATDANNILGRECSVDSSDQFKPCDPKLVLQNLTEGNHLIYACTTDMAKNKSDTIQFTFLVDTVAPVIIITKEPTTNTTDSVGVFSFTYSDANPSSGIDRIECFFDDVKSVTDCSNGVATSPTGLSKSTHKFKVFAVDKAQNKSIVHEKTWTMTEALTLGDFSILGVSPVNINQLNPNWLVGSLNPKIYHTDSTHATAYHYEILQGSAVKCSDDNPLFSKNNCTLEDKQTYTVKIVATGLNKDGTVAVPKASSNQFTFTVDKMSPTVSNLLVSQPTTAPHGNNIKLNYKANDISGIKSIKLILTGPTSTEEQKNYSATPIQSQINAEIAYSNLSPGDYKFKIFAVDNNNQESTSVETNFNVKPDEYTKLLAVTSKTTESQADLKVMMVIDNSGSMRSSQTNLGNNINSLISSLKGKKAEIMIITMDDYIRSYVAVNGNERNLQTRVKKGELDQAARVYKLESTDQSFNDVSANIKKYVTCVNTSDCIGTNGSDFERPLLSFGLRLTDETATRFFKKDSLTLVYFLTDEDDLDTFFRDDYNHLMRGSDQMPGGGAVKVVRTDEEEKKIKLASRKPFIGWYYAYRSEKAEWYKEGSIWHTENECRSFVEARAQDSGRRYDDENCKRGVYSPETYFNSCSDFYNKYQARDNLSLYPNENYHLHDYDFGDTGEYSCSEVNSIKKDIHYGLFDIQLKRKSYYTKNSAWMSQVYGSIEADRQTVFSKMKEALETLTSGKYLVAASVNTSNCSGLSDTQSYDTSFTKMKAVFGDQKFILSPICGTSSEMSAKLGEISRRFETVIESKYNLVASIGFKPTTEKVKSITLIKEGSVKVLLSAVDYSVDATGILTVKDSVLMNVVNFEIVIQ